MTHCSNSTFTHNNKSIFSPSSLFLLLSLITISLSSLSYNTFNGFVEASAAASDDNSFPPQQENRLISGSRVLNNGTFALQWTLNPSTDSITFSGEIQTTGCWAGVGIAPHRIWEQSDKVTQKKGDGPWGIAMVQAAITVIEVDCEDKPPAIKNYYGKSIQYGNTGPQLVDHTYATLNVNHTYRDPHTGKIHFEFSRSLQADASATKDDMPIVDGLNNIIYAFRDDSTHFGYHGPSSRGGFQLNPWDPEWEPKILPETVFSKEPISLLDGNVLLSYLYDSDRITFTLEAKTKGWLALGFKKDNSPGMQNALLVVYEPEKQKMSQHALTNSLNGFPPETETNPEYSFDGYHYNPGTKRSTFRFSRPLSSDDGSFNKIDPSIALQSPNYWLVATANSDDDRSLKYHGPNRALFTYEFSSRSPWYTYLEWAHGMCMIAAWMGFATIATFMGRYGRKRFNGRTANGRGLRGVCCWFVTHHTWMMIVTIFLTVLGFILILFRQGTVMPASQVFNVWNHPHTMLGFIIVVTCVIQGCFGAVSAALYDRTQRRGRSASHVAMVHWYIGRVLLLASFINIYLGMNLVNAHIASYVLYYIYVPLVISVFIFARPSVDPRGEASSINRDEDENNESSPLL